MFRAQHFGKLRLLRFQQFDLLLRTEVVALGTARTEHGIAACRRECGVGGGFVFLFALDGLVEVQQVEQLVFAFVVGKLLAELREVNSRAGSLLLEERDVVLFLEILQLVVTRAHFLLPARKLIRQGAERVLGFHGAHFLAVVQVFLHAGVEKFLRVHRIAARRREHENGGAKRLCDIDHDGAGEQTGFEALQAFGGVALDFVAAHDLDLRVKKKRQFLAVARLFLQRHFSAHDKTRDGAVGSRLRGGAPRGGEQPDCDRDRDDPPALADERLVARQSREEGNPPRCGTGLV